MSICAFHDCGWPASQRDLCKEHYQQWWDNDGDITKLTPIKQPPNQTTLELSPADVAYLDSLSDFPSIKDELPNGPNCKFPKCPNKSRALGYCDTHYRQLKRNGPDGLKPIKQPLPVPVAQPTAYGQRIGCKHPKCAGRHYIRGLCKRCYERWLYQKKRGHVTTTRPDPVSRGIIETCTHGDCQEDAFSRGLCPRHYKRWHAHQVRMRRKKLTRKKIRWYG